MRILALSFLSLLMSGTALAVGPLLPPGSKPFKISGEEEGIYVIDLDPTKPAVMPRFLLLVRDTDGDLDIIARAEVEVIQKHRAFLKFDGDFINKAPVVGDMAVAISASAPEEKNELAGDIREVSPNTEDVSVPEPGYIQLMYGSSKGDLQSQAFDHHTNEFKDAPSYNLTEIQFLWYIEFMWRLGIEFQTRGGTFPTRTYKHKDGNSTESETQFALLFRTRAFWEDRLRAAVRVSQFSSDFATINDDENLLGTSYQGSGLGLRFDYENSPPTWTPAKPTWFGFNFHSLALGYDLYPVIKAKDKLISRGEDSAGSNRTDMMVSANFFIYSSPVPFLKRWMLSIGFRQGTTKMKFSGKTKNETNGIYVIPEGGDYTEKRVSTFIAIGWRFDDVVGKFFKPR